MALRLMVVSHSYMEEQTRQKWFALRDADSEADILVVTPKRWRERDLNWVLLAEPEVGDRIRFVPTGAVWDGFVSRHVYSWASLTALMRSFRPHLIQVEAEPWSAVYAQVA